jgi:SET and MYND domain-containing protein
LAFPVLTKQWYISVLARIRINAFRIELAGGGSYEDLLSSAFASVEAEAAVGNAVYILPSFYNHDCGEYNFLLLFTIYVINMSLYVFFTVSPLSVA